ncbi:hypothetical protein KC19_3G040100 [Ceratodon purpureus]|uniref:Uncharacterized protein n=1 Tax=Ceratodon purpureus TaxID=3225 RepID=A0A8T0IGX5_CERPU|nr:hypothetical protein KC19_3G040100 [Ceratodon purpureus]
MMPQLQCTCTTFGFQNCLKIISMFRILNTNLQQELLPKCGSLHLPHCLHVLYTGILRPHSQYQHLLSPMSDEQIYPARPPGELLQYKTNSARSTVWSLVHTH